MRSLLLALALAAPLQAAEALQPRTYVSGTTKAHGDPPLTAPIPDAPALASPTAALAAPTALTLAAEAAPASPTAAAAAASPTAEAEVEEDDMVATPAHLDLAQAETKLLSKIAEAADKDAGAVLFNLEEAVAVEKKGAGVAEVKADELFLELAKRHLNGDRAAGKALALADAKGDLRVRGAKSLAFEDKAANSFIKRLENGDKAAKAEIEKLASKGNRRAREFLGLDKVKAEAAPLTSTPKVEAPAPVSPAAK